MDNLIGVFPNKEAADVVFLNLVKAGYRNQDISVVIKEDLVLNKESGRKGGIASSYLASGILSGGLIGGFTGILVGLSAILVPGLGAVLIAGPLASMLGIGGAAAVTISGVVTGVLAGGLAAGLVEIGLEKNIANFYERKVKDGEVLVCVPVAEKTISQVRQIFTDHGGVYIKEIKDKSKSNNHS